MSEMKYQVKMTYDREDIAALVRTMEGSIQNSV